MNIGPTELIILVFPLLAVALIVLGIISAAKSRNGASPPGANGSTSGLVSAGAGWFPDPTGRNGQRYWDGSSWTVHVSNNGAPGTDPV